MTRSVETDEIERLCAAHTEDELARMIDEATVEINHLNAQLKHLREKRIDLQLAAAHIREGRGREWEIVI